MSLVEAGSNTLLGFGVNVVAQAMIFPIFGIYVSFNQDLEIGGLFTVISIMRSYTLRRIYEAIRVRQNSSIRYRGEQGQR